MTRTKIEKLIHDIKYFLKVGLTSKQNKEWCLGYREMARRFFQSMDQHIDFGDEFVECRITNTEWQELKETLFPINKEVQK